MENIDIIKNLIKVNYKLVKELEKRENQSKSFLPEIGRLEDLLCEKNDTIQKLREDLTYQTKTIAEREKQIKELELEIKSYREKNTELTKTVVDLEEEIKYQ